MANIIGIDVYSALHSPRGMGVYTINFLKELAKIDKETKYILYADIEDENNVLPKQENFKLKVLKAKGLFNYEQFVLPKQCKKDGIFALHSPAITSPIFLDKKIKRILTQHDITFLKRHIPVSRRKKQILGRIYYSLCTILNIRKADILLTVSEYSKNDIKETFKMRNKEIIITPNGFEHFNTDEAETLEELNRKYSIPEKYFFNLGGEAPSKNTELLLKVFSQNPDMNLVVAGIRDPQASPLAKDYFGYKNIIFVPYISQKDLVGIYKNTIAFIFPSLYEGFGIPLLEAMKCECPIICSNASCLPEVAGDAALYFNPYSPDGLKECMEKIKDVNVVNELKNNAKNQLNKYSWTETAQKIKEVYSNAG